MSRPILAIKLSALGDLFFALPALQAIRDHHQGQPLVLLTAKRFVPLMQSTGLFADVWADERPAWWQLGKLLALTHRLRNAGFVRVYDLQWSQRSNLYLRLIGRCGRERVGATAAADLRYPGRRDRKPIRDRLAEMLQQAGIDHVPAPNLSFLDADISSLALPARFALLVPGSSTKATAKRWPAAQYAELAAALYDEGLTPVVVCGPEEAEVTAELRRTAPFAHFVETSLGQLAALARRAVVAVGNDTGPTHLAALVGCPCVMLFGPTDPVKQRPWGNRVSLVAREPISEMPLVAVLAAVHDVL